MENDIEVLGYWWFEGYPNKRFPGLLKFNQSEGGVLKVFYDTDNDDSIKPYQKYDIINGLFENKLFTLVNCRFIGLSMNRISYCTFEINLIIYDNVEQCISCAEELKFSGLNARMENTNRFFERIDAYEFSREVVGENQKFLLTETPQKISFDVDETLGGSISLGMDYEVSRIDKLFNVAGAILFSIQTKDNSLINLEILENEMNNLRIFFSVVMQGVCVYNQLSVDKPSYSFSCGLYKQNTFGEASSRFMLFDLRLVESRISSILTTWFRLCREIPEVLSLFYSAYTSSSFYEYHFRDSYAALEGLFQWKMKEDTENKMVVNILANEITRPKERRENIPTFGKVVKGVGKWGDVARKNRHYQMHFNKTKYADDIVGRYELLKLTRKMQAVILCHLLIEVGLTDGEIERAFSMNEKYFSPL